MQKPTRTSYLLDQRERIVSVDGAWDAFAEENGGCHLSAAELWGHSIWEYVAGDNTKMWLTALFQYARLKGSGVTRPYRCDSPELKRYMQMTVRLESGSLLRVDHELLYTEPRTPALHFRHSGRHDQAPFTRCSNCGRIHVGAWVEPDPSHANTGSTLTVVYSVCPTCQALAT